MATDIPEPMLPSIIEHWANGNTMEDISVALTTTGYVCSATTIENMLRHHFCIRPQRSERTVDPMEESQQGSESESATSSRSEASEEHEDDTNHTCESCYRVVGENGCAFVVRGRCNLCRSRYGGRSPPATASEHRSDQSDVFEISVRPAVDADGVDGACPLCHRLFSEEGGLFYSRRQPYLCCHLPDRPCTLCHRGVGEEGCEYILNGRCDLCRRADDTCSICHRALGEEGCTFIWNERCNLCKDAQWGKELASLGIPLRPQNDSDRRCVSCHRLVGRLSLMMGRCDLCHEGYLASLGQTESEDASDESDGSQATVRNEDVPLSDCKTCRGRLERGVCDECGVDVGLGLD